MYAREFSHHMFACVWLAAAAIYDSAHCSHSLTLFWFIHRKNNLVTPLREIVRVASHRERKWMSTAFLCTKILFLCVCATKNSLVQLHHIKFFSFIRRWCFFFRCVSPKECRRGKIKENFVFVCVIKFFCRHFHHHYVLSTMLLRVIKIIFSFSRFNVMSCLCLVCAQKWEIMFQKSLALFTHQTLNWAWKVSILSINYALCIATFPPLLQSLLGFSIGKSVTLYWQRPAWVNERTEESEKHCQTQS